MDFLTFCRVQGVIIDALPPAGLWRRYPTTDHPRKKNGAVKFLGDVGFCQNHATSVDVSVWRPDGDAPAVDMRRITEQVKAFERKQRDGWARAARKANALLREAKPGESAYLQLKGFPEARGLVLPDGALLVPMRHWRTNDLVGAQVIRWDDIERKHEKKMLPCMRAKGAVFRIGSAMAGRTWLVEGLATGLSVEAAIRLRSMRDSVLVCFSAGNLIHVAGLIGGEKLVFADNDASGAGRRAAEATGARWCMSGTVGHDANDMHQQEGIFKVASLMMNAINSEVESGT